jgi:hypothetical protein
MRFYLIVLSFLSIFLCLNSYAQENSKNGKNKQTKQQGKQQGKQQDKQTKQLIKDAQKAEKSQDLQKALQLYVQIQNLSPSSDHLFKIAELSSTLKYPCAQTIKAWEMFLENCSKCKTKSKAITQYQNLQQACFVEIFIDSQPQGAQVFLNQQPMGLTPVRERMMIGQYQIKLSLQQFQEISEQISFSAENLKQNQYYYMFKPLAPVKTQENGENLLDAPPPKENRKLLPWIMTGVGVLTVGFSVFYYMSAGEILSDQYRGIQNYEQLDPNLRDQVLKSQDTYAKQTRTYAQFGMIGGAILAITGSVLVWKF